MLNSLKSMVVPVAKNALLMANIRPGVVKALVKKRPVVHGGPRARVLPWPTRRHYDKREIQAVLRLLNREITVGGAVTYNGPEKAAYCRAFAEFLGGGFAEPVNSGTNALYVALRAL